MQRTSLVIGLVGGVVLWPGLVAAYYGADVTGLPGQEADTGLLVMIVASVLGAVAFGGWVLLYGRRR